MRRIAALAAVAAATSLHFRADEAAAFLWGIAAVAGGTAIRRFHACVHGQAALLRRIAAVRARSAAAHLRGGGHAAAENAKKQSQGRK